PARGEPVLLRLPDPLAPLFTGTFPVTTSNWFATADVNYRRTLLCEDAYRLDALFGYRFGYVIDEVYLGDRRENEDKDHRLNRVSRLGDVLDPAGGVRTTDFWVQSVGLGMELRF